MEKTWVLVANRSGAKLFEGSGPRKTDLQLLRDIPHPEGRLHARDINTDKPGRVHDSSGARSAMSSQVGPEEHLAEEFARRLGEILNKGRNDHAYQKLILVAEPGFLGNLKGVLDKNTLALVEKSVGKDLMHVGEKELQQFLN